MGKTEQLSSAVELNESIDGKGLFRVIVNEVLAYLKKKVDSENNTEKQSTTDLVDQSISQPTTEKVVPGVEIKNQAEAVAAFMKQPLMEKVKENREAFALQMILLAQRLKTKPEWLLAVMNTETAGTMDPSIQNPETDATGLIQFMPKTAKGLGTTVAALKNMSNVEQLEYVFKYMDSLGMVGKLNSLEDVYLAVFFPAAVGHSNDPSYVFQAKGLTASRVARSNPIFNADKDQKITMSEFSSYVRNNLASKIDASLQLPETYYA